MLKNISLLICICRFNPWEKNRKFGPLNGNRGSGSGKHFLDAFGFDSQTSNSECFASFSYTLPGSVETTMIVDHGFRVLDDDPYVVSPSPPAPNF